MTNAEIDIRVLGNMTLEEALEERRQANIERAIVLLEQGSSASVWTEADLARLDVSIEIAIRAGA